MAIEIAPELEARLNTFAAARGMDVNNFVTAVLTRAVQEESEDSELVLSEEEAARLHEGILRGQASVEAGRTRPARDFFAELEAKYGLPTK